MMKKAMGYLPVASGLAALVVVGGCASATFVPTGAAYPAKAQDCVIEVFSSALPDREYEEIGIIEGKGSFWKSDLEDVLPKIKEQACLAGGDAVILQSAGRYAEGEHGVKNVYAVSTVIRWKQD